MRHLDRSGLMWSRSQRGDEKEPDSKYSEAVIISTNREGVWTGNKKPLKVPKMSDNLKLHTADRSVIKTWSIPKTLSNPRKQAHFAPDILMCISDVCGLLETILCLSGYQPFGFIEGEHFCGFKAVQLHLSNPFVYIFLLIITSVALGMIKMLSLGS